VNDSKKSGFCKKITESNIHLLELILADKLGKKLDLPRANPAGILPWANHCMASRAPEIYLAAFRGAPVRRLRYRLQILPVLTATSAA
jgi:hypothetical protein